MVPGVVSAPLWYEDIELVLVFLFCQFFFKNIYFGTFFRWLQVVPVVFSSFILTCYLELSWFHFLLNLSPLGEINHFWNKSAF